MEREEMEKEQKKWGEDRLALLQEENKVHMTRMLVKHETEEKEKGGGCERKRKREEAEGWTEKQPAVPECLVCLDEMAPPSRSFSAATDTTSVAAAGCS